MYEYGSLGPDYGKIKGTTDDFEKALEQVWRFQEWYIRREEKNCVVLWRMKKRRLVRNFVQIILRSDGNATDTEIDSAMRKEGG